MLLGTGDLIVIRLGLIGVHYNLIPLRLSQAK